VADARVQAIELVNLQPAGDVERQPVIRVVGQHLRGKAVGGAVVAQVELQVGLLDEGQLLLGGGDLAPQVSELLQLGPVAVQDLDLAFQALAHLLVALGGDAQVLLDGLLQLLDPLDLSLQILAHLVDVAQAVQRRHGEAQTDQDRRALQKAEHQVHRVNGIVGALQRVNLGVGGDVGRDHVVQAGHQHGDQQQHHNNGQAVDDQARRGVMPL